MKYVVQKLVYATAEIEAETEDDAICEAKCLSAEDWNICEFDASEDYDIIEEKDFDEED